MKVIYQSRDATPHLASLLQELIDSALRSLGKRSHVQWRGRTIPAIPVEFDKGWWTISQYQDDGPSPEEEVAMLVKKTIDYLRLAHNLKRPFPDPEAPLPTPTEALAIIEGELGVCRFNWITGQVARDTLKKILEHQAV